MDSHATPEDSSKNGISLTGMPFVVYSFLHEEQLIIYLPLRFS